MIHQQKIKWQLGVLAGLVIANALFFFWAGRDNREAVDQNVFVVSELEKVNRVEIEYQGETTRLSFNGARWLVNDKYNADADMIKVLFATIAQARPKRTLPQAMKDSVQAVLKADGRRMKLFSEEEIVADFIAGGNEAKTQAWFMEPATGDVYVMNIPGYRVYVSGIFELSDREWRSKYIFDFNWRNFQGIAVEFPGKSADDFEVVQDKSMFIVKGIQTDTSKLNPYLDQLSALTADQVGENLNIDSASAIPIMRIKVMDIAGRVYPVNIYPRDSAGFPGLTSRTDLVRFDPRRISPLLKPKTWFRPQ